VKIVGMLPVYEEADWVEWAVEGIIDFVDFLVIAEGYQGPPYHFRGNRSRDGTLDILRKLKSRYPGKIKFIKCAWGWHVNHGKARTHNRVLNTIAKCGLLEENNWYFLVDSDEFYTKEQLSEIRKVIENTDKDLLIVHDRMFVYNFYYFIPATHGRLIRITKDMFFKPAQFPCYSNGTTYASQTEKVGYVLEDEPMFHYSFVRPNERMIKRIKMEFLARMYKPEVFNWFNKVYMKWSEENAEEIYRLNEEITGNTGFLFAGRSSKLQEYTGIHPEFLDDHPYRRINDLRESQNNCQAKITSSLFFLRLFQNFGAGIKALLRKVPGLRNKN